MALLMAEKPQHKITAVVVASAESGHVEEFIRDILAKNFEQVVSLKVEPDNDFAKARE